MREEAEQQYQHDIEKDELGRYKNVPKELPNQATWTYSITDNAELVSETPSLGCIWCKEMGFIEHVYCEEFKDKNQTQ